MAGSQNDNKDNIEIKIPRKLFEELKKNMDEHGCGCGCILGCVVNVAL